ncbi:nucleotide sugar dehydrogenase, partial [candidate division WOR-3 bacterium]|nr:nucleotide sugar dehydrogenase [candidate division WOR-3 bacterium]
MMNKLLEKIRNRKACIGIIGLGYVGLPLAVEYALTGYKVYGIDLLEEKIKMLKSGKSYIIDVKKSNIKKVIKNKLLVPSTKFDVIKKVDIVIIAVPTPLRKSKDPDTSYITNAVNSIKKYLHKDMLIVLESTTYPGTTRELIADEIADMGFTLSKDIFIAFSPERVDPGNKEYNTKNTPKVVGGLAKKDTEIACAIYSEVIENIVKVNTLEEAEMVKLLENTFRAVNIGLVNELAIMCHRMNIDIWNVINAAATKPFGFMPFFPGPGIGGHCIPLDPMYLAWRAKMYDYYNRFIELSSDVNSNMPRFIVGKVGELLNKHKKSVNGSKILLMGVAYKKDIDDLRESPSLEIYKLLKEEGAVVDYTDTYVPFF